MRSGLKFRKPARWQPKKWIPLYETMVGLSSMGRSNKYIAEVFGYTPQQVSNILTSDEAKLVLEVTVARIRDGATLTINSKLERLAERAVHNIETVLNDDNKLEQSPFAIVDRSMALLKGLKKLQGDSPTVEVNNQQTFVTDKGAETIVRAIERSQQVKELQAKNET